MSTEQKRKGLPSTDSIEDDSDKRQRVEAEMPGWAAAMMARNDANTKKVIARFDERFDLLESEVHSMKLDVDNLTARCNAAEDKQSEVEDSVNILNEKIDGLEAALAEQTDRSMRSTISIHKIPKTADFEKWEVTTDIVAKFLAQHCGDSVETWRNRIERCHRGKTTVIHCRFESWRYAEEVRQAFKSSKGRIGDVFYLDKFSIHTMNRRQKAWDLRKQLMDANPGMKASVRYPATLYAKAANDSKFSEYKSF